MLRRKKQQLTISDSLLSLNGVSYYYPYALDLVEFVNSMTHYPLALLEFTK